MKNLLLIISLLLITSLLSAQTPPVVYVAADGTGDFNCDGTSDQTEINQALDFVEQNPQFTTVYLKGPATYWIDEPIFIPSNTILEGDSTAMIKLIDHAGWNTKFKPLITQKGMTYTQDFDTSINCQNIIIRGFEIDGNRRNQSEPSGNHYYNIILLRNCKNIIISNMYLHDNLADAVNIDNTNYYTDINLKFFNNRVHNSGHDGIYVGKATNFEIYNNNFSNNRTDAHIRVQNCNAFRIYNNIAGNDPDNRNSGGIGIDIQASYDFLLDSAEVFGNYLYGKGAFHGIWLWQTSDGGYLNSHKNVHIHHNIITGYQGSGIAIYGFNNTLIEFNVIELNGQGNNTSVWDNVPLGKHSGITFYQGGNGRHIKGYTTIVRNNIIGNNSAYGLENRKPSIHKFISEYNCLYNNGKGNYKNATSHTDIYVNPDYACPNPYTTDDARTDYAYYILSDAWMQAKQTGDFRSLDVSPAILVYHLQSRYGRWHGTQWVQDSITSFCINAGDPAADYSNEPQPNGSRVNIGAFGNTPFASKGEQIPDIHSFMVYPNPTSGQITISAEFVNNPYYIYTLSGRLITSGILHTNQLNLSDLPPGIYLIKIRMHHSNHWRTAKVLVE